MHECLLHQIGLDIPLMKVVGGLEEGTRLAKLEQTISKRDLMIIHHSILHMGLYQTHIGIQPSQSVELFDTPRLTHDADVLSQEVGLLLFISLL